MVIQSLSTLSHFNTATHLNSTKMEKYEIIKDIFTYVRRFGVKGRKMEFKIRPIPKNIENPVKWIREAIEQIVLYATERVNPTDQIGFTFCSKEFAEKTPGWLSFREASKVSTNDVWRVIGAIFQSNSEGMNTDSFCLAITTVKLPEGRGQRVRDRMYPNFEEECIKRKGIIVINNKDNLCLPRALVVAMAKASNPNNYREMRRNIGKVQDKAALQLMQDANVKIPEDGGCGLPELRLFQEYLTPTYKIVVYDYGKKGRTVIYEGETAATHNLNLLYHQGHYNTITSLTAAFSCSYFCELCHIPYDNKNKHRCAASCPCCRQSPPCVTSTNIICDLCNRPFRGKHCFENHLKAALCSDVRRCTDCLKTIKSNRTHVCGEVFCKLCNGHFPANHLCFIRADRRTPPTDNFLFIYYDLETRQETKLNNETDATIHEPNLCVYQQCCDKCYAEKNLYFCQKCGFRQTIIQSDIVASFLRHILELRRKFKRITCIAHNAQSFDVQFILKYILEKTDMQPELIMRGTKILMLELDSVRFIDSLNYFPMALSKLPEAFDLGVEMKKGYFPHLFNTIENATYTGPLPDIKFYSPDTMRTEDRTKFLQWYEMHKDDEFNMQRDLVDYCVSDVSILKNACIKFRNMFLAECNVCPFIEAMTIASACNLVYRRGYLKPNTIGVIPRGGYRWRDNQSKAAIQWLLWEEQQRGIDIQHAAKGFEAVIAGTRVDGFCEKTLQIFEFHGCYYHGHPACMPSNRNAPLFDDTADTLTDRYQSTMLRTERLRSAGYEVVEMWECQFRKLQSNNADVRVLNAHPLLNRAVLNPRDAFYGGRTGATKFYYKIKPGEKIKYIDVCSLYPWVCKYGKFPIGHPTLHVGPEACSKIDVFAVDGLIKCKILPPQNLYHPVLPMKQNNKLIFSLCRVCSEMQIEGECDHTDNDRVLTGTWVIDEIRTALKHGYKMIEMYEVWQYSTEQYNTVSKMGGLFAEFMNKFIKTKQQASGWPSSCITDDQKNRYIEEFFNVEGIQLEYGQILKNPGLRSLAKLMLNSFWGKFGQKENQTKTAIVREPEVLYSMLTDPSITVNHIHEVNEEALIVSWERKEEASEVLSTVNVCIAAYTTALARLKLYEYLELLGERVLYYDTDSVLYISREGEKEPSIGSSLGEMTDELECYGSGSYITEFVSGGPKNYSYKVFSPTLQKEFVTIKVKGIRLNYDSEKSVNFENLSNMVLKESAPVYITSRNIRRTIEHEVISKTEQKVFRTVFGKRRRVENHDSVPYGYKKCKFV